VGGASFGASFAAILSKTRFEGFDASFGLSLSWRKACA
jgi:hypothetical protein